VTERRHAAGASRIARLAPLRFGLTNILMVAFIAALIKGGYFVWLSVASIVLISVVGDEIHGDDTELPANQSHWFCDANLYATLPLIIASTVIYLHYLTSRDPLGLIADLADLGINFAAAPSLSSSGPLIGATLGVGIFYALAANTVGHELVHRSRNPIAVGVGRVLLAFTFNAAFAIYHVPVHHRHAATLADPITARRGESLYAYARRTIAARFRCAFEREGRRLRRRGVSIWSWHNRMLRGELWSVAIMASAMAVAGLPGLAGFIVAAAIGEMLFLAIDYAQHYGLVRAEGAPFAARHAWDCYRGLSNALHYNLPRHSDHHQNAGKEFWRLNATSEAPLLPYGYEAMALIAFVPPLWHRLMRPQLVDWDRRLASDDERGLVHARGWAIEPVPSSGQARDRAA